MKILFLLLTTLSLACNTKQEKQTIKIPDPIIAESAWLKSFKKLKAAAYDGDSERMKEFFDFPVSDSSNLWGLIEFNIDSTVNKGTRVSAKDFQQFFSQIFPIEFIETIGGIESGELKKGSSKSSPSIVNDVTYVMYAEWDKNTETLQLHLYSEQDVETGDETPFKAEFSKLYQWRLNKNGVFKFVRVDFAG